MARSGRLSTILLQAMQLERDGHAFYLAAAQETAAPAGRRMFLSLAQDELHHLEILDGFYRRHLAGEPLPEEEVPAGAGRHGRPIFPPPAAAAQVVAPHTGDLEALHRGIAAEQASIDLYRHGLETAEDPRLREMYAFLLEQEEGHRTILEGEYNYLTHTGFWFDLREFNLEAMA